MQLELQQYDGKYWLRQGSQLDAVVAFFNHVSQFEPARARLTREHQAAFYQTVKTGVQHLWGNLSDATARVAALLQLAAIPSIALQAQQLEDLANYVTQVDLDSITTLILVHRVWNLCQNVEHRREKVANTLGHYYIRHEIWELTNNQPWKRYLSKDLVMQLRIGCEQNSASHLSRELAFLKHLQEPDITVLTPFLVQEQAELQRHVERDIQNIVAGSAG